MIEYFLGLKEQDRFKDLQYTLHKILNRINQEISNEQNRFTKSNSFEYLMMKESTYPSYNLSRNNDEIQSLAYSFCGKFWALGSQHNKIIVWNIEQKKEEFTLTGHSNFITLVCFSPDGKYIASVSYGKSIKIWNFDERQEEFSLEGHLDFVSLVCFSPDGKHLASGSEDKSLKIWNFEQKREKLSLNSHSKQVIS